MFYFTMSRAIFDDFVLQLFYKRRFLTLFWTPKMTKTHSKLAFLTFKTCSKKKMFFLRFLALLKRSQKGQFRVGFHFFGTFCDTKMSWRAENRSKTRFIRKLSRFFGTFWHFGNFWVPSVQIRVTKTVWKMVGFLDHPTKRFLETTMEITQKGSQPSGPRPGLRRTPAPETFFF